MKTFWAVAVVTLCAVVYMNASCDPTQNYSYKKPLACYFGETP